MTRMKILAAAGGLVAIVVAAALYLSLFRFEGYFAPIYSPAGKSVYYVQRNTIGFVWGLGIEFFTPPAHGWALDDRVSIRRLDIDSGEIAVLREWSRTPVSRRHLREYRGRVFQTLMAQLGWDESGNLRYAMELDVTRIPFSEQDVVNGYIPMAGGSGEGEDWREGYRQLGAADGPVLAGPWEIAAVPGREAYPAALVAFADGSGEARVLLHNSDFHGLYPDGVPLEMLRERSRRADIERIQEIERVQSELVARYRADGASEIDAILRANKEMERLGYYPKSPTLTARLLPSGEAPDSGIPEFAIEPMQFTVGLLPDIEQALAAPGTAIEKDWAGYIVHDDYDTSQRLNAHLATGADRFYVRYDGRLYEMTIERP